MLGYSHNIYATIALVSIPYWNVTVYCNLMDHGDFILIITYFQNNKILAKKVKLLVEHHLDFHMFGVISLLCLHENFPKHADLNLFWTCMSMSL